MRKTHQRGFTIVEIMIGVTIVAILGAVALPQYRAYVTRSKVPTALDALSAMSTRMEQYYQDSARGNYGTASCGNGMVLQVVENFTLSCALTNGGQGYIATATGKSGSGLEAYTYTIDHRGNRVTTAHPKGPKPNCWSISGQVCDS